MSLTLGLSIGLAPALDVLAKGRAAVPVPIEKPERLQRLSNGDFRIFNLTLRHLRAGQDTEAHRIARQAQDPLIANLLRWLLLYEGSSTAKLIDYTAFLNEYENWPGQRQLRRKAEEAETTAMKASDVVAFFNAYPPLTGIGRQRFADALLAVGDTQAGQSLLRRIWVEENFPKRHQQALFRQHRKLFSTEDHIARTDHLLWQGQFSAVRRMLSLLPKAQQRLAQARMALARREGNVDTAIAQVPKRLRSDPGLVYERIRWRRRADDDAGAVDLLVQPPTQIGPRPDRWWLERRIQIRRLLEEKRAKEAYQLARKHRQTPGSLGFAEAEFLAGWLALRHLQQADSAEQHFQRLAEHVRFPISLARAHYWLARTAKKKGADEAIISHFRQAAAFSKTYYGQLAAGHLAAAGIDTRPRLAALLAPNEFTQKQQAAFETQSFVRIVRFVSALGHSRYAEPFLRHLMRHAEDDVERLQVAALADDIARPSYVLREVKRLARQRAYPAALSHPLIDITASKLDDIALVLAIARQESEFVANARSRSGALGLMQLMPTTARHVARGLGLPYDQHWLVSDTHYNITLGSAYLSRLLQRYDGHRVLGIAAYNAGPHRVNKWLRIFGDPRKDNVDLVDWIEQIPFSETRNYVQRVLENYQIYQLRLAHPRPQQKPHSIPQPLPRQDAAAQTRLRLSDQDSQL